MRVAAIQSIDLDPVDWFWAPWRDCPPLLRPEPAPFDFSDCITRLQLARGRRDRWNWSKCSIAPALSTEEAHFWFEAMLRAPDLEARELNHHLSRLEFERSANRPIDLGRLRDNRVVIRPEIMLPLAHFLSPEAIVEVLLLGNEVIPEDPPFAPGAGRLARSVLRDGFRRYLLPYLDDAQRERLRLLLRGWLDLDLWPSDARSVPVVFSLAAALGMHRELRPLVESWPDAASGRRTFVFQNNERQNVIFGLNSREEILFHLRRLRLRPLQPEHARAWLANAGLDAVDWICDTIQVLPKKEQATVVLEGLCLVRSPLAAPHMLDLKLNSHAPRLARRWLDENMDLAVAGLVPVAAGHGKLAEAAREQLEEYVRLGHRALLEEQLRLLPTVAGRELKNELVAKQEEIEPLRSHETPDWLRSALEEVPALEQDRLADWLRIAVLPPVIVGDRTLNDAHRQALVTALRTSSLGDPQPLIRAVGEHADRASLAAFAWKLLRSWRDDGMSASGSWVINAVGFLGDDNSSTRLMSLLSSWRDRDDFRHAPAALASLGAIGTDTALMHLLSVARDPRWKRLQDTADELLNVIASRRGIAREQLEDLLLPGPGGNGMFDFGRRHFRLTIGPDLKPRLLDRVGRLRRKLPRPSARDDAKKAALAEAQWQSLKRHLRQTVKLHIRRLEEAMIAGRRWKVCAFERLLGHPLLSALARRLVWGGYDKQGRRVWTFRIAEEGCCVGLEDEPCPTEEVQTLGIVHPTELSDPEREAWRMRLDVEQPFEQLERVFVLLSPEEQEGSELDGFDHFAIPAQVLWRVLRKQGWMRAARVRPGGLVVYEAISRSGSHCCDRAGRARSVGGVGPVRVAQRPAVLLPGRLAVAAVQQADAPGVGGAISPERSGVRAGEPAGEGRSPAGSAAVAASHELFAGDDAGRRVRGERR